MITVAACQVRIDIDDPETTWQAATTAVREAARAGAEVVVLPELTLQRDRPSLRCAEAVGRAEAANGPTAVRMGRLSAELGVVLIFGFVESNPDGERPYNSLLVLDRGEPLAVYRKTHLWDQEKLIFAAGDEIAPVIDTSAGRLAAMICYDLEFPEMVRDVTLRGAQLIAVPANWPRGAQAGRRAAGRGGQSAGRSRGESGLHRDRRPVRPRARRRLVRQQRDLRPARLPGRRPGRRRAGRPAGRSRSRSGRRQAARSAQRCLGRPPSRPRRGPAAVAQQATRAS